MDKLVLLLLCFASHFTYAQVDTLESTQGIDFYIHEEVTNAHGEIEQQLIKLWQNYIADGNFQDLNSPYWSFKNMNVPDENFWAIGIDNLKKRAHKVQCKVIGISKLKMAIGH